MNLQSIDIHPSHTKHSLCRIIQNSNMDIFQPYMLNKEKILNVLESYLLTTDHELKFFDPTLPFQNKKDFIIFLGEAPNKLSSAEKRLISDNAKQIIMFCKSGYDFSKTKYETFLEVHNECLKIKEYGDIFCVRTAINLFNITLPPEEQIQCKISPLLHNQLQIKNAYKKNCVPKLQVKQGKFIVEFD